LNYHRHQGYQSPGAAFLQSNSFNSHTAPKSTRYNFNPGNSAAASPHSTAPTVRTSVSSTALSTTRNVQQNTMPVASKSSTAAQRSSAERKRRSPNWGEFYRNGIPKEIIVIDDDSPVPSEVPTEPVASPQPPSRKHGITNGTTNGTARHNAKRRRKGPSALTYDPVYPEQNGYSVGETPQYGDSPSATTISSGRTTSALNTTAATSLGSHYSNGATNGEEVTGQKRKRTRQAVADEAKRHQAEREGQAWNVYHPPPKPPIKAKEVYVHVEADTTVTKHQTVDDDDGHYIVVPDSALTN
jgi:dual-specificity kinase